MCHSLYMGRGGLYQMSRCYRQVVECCPTTTHKLYFGWALTPVLPTVVLVPFNHMTMLALVQLGIQNNHSNQPFLKRLWREL